MNKYYIFKIESLIQTFTVVDSGKVISFQYSSQEEHQCFEDIQTGDLILGYYDAPVNMIKLIFEVESVTEDNRLELLKKIEVQDGVVLENNNLLTELEHKSLINISEDMFEEIYTKMLKNQERIYISTGKPKRNSSVTDLSRITFTAPKIPVSYNYLVFGAPGTGKSHELRKLQEKYFADCDTYERVTFYSNYSYPNFVGTYKPKMDGKDITYSFVPGPFIRILEKAYKNPDKNFLLIIEEINRANPAAAFGDIFQLLDRNEGKSEYSIAAGEDLKLYFAEQSAESFENMTDEEKEIVLSGFKKIYIPPNMYIWATMNSADQGVYPMDTAFKRRWDFKYIGVNDNMESMQNVVFEAPHESAVQKISWNKLRIKINEVLSGPQCRVNEDKLLGPYFISSEVMAIDQTTQSFDESSFNNKAFVDAFKNKVIMYLFEDAAKQKRTEVFKGCDDVSKFSSICEAFDKKGIEIFGDEIAKSVLIG